MEGDGLIFLPHCDGSDHGDLREGLKMFKGARWRSEKNKIKAVFKLQFEATQVKCRRYFLEQLTNGQEFGNALGIEGSTKIRFLH